MATRNGTPARFASAFVKSGIDERERVLRDAHVGLRRDFLIVEHHDVRGAEIEREEALRILSVARKREVSVELRRAIFVIARDGQNQLLTERQKFRRIVRIFPCGVEPLRKERLLRSLQNEIA